MRRAIRRPQVDDMNVEDRYGADFEMTEDRREVMRLRGELKQAVRERDLAQEALRAAAVVRDLADRVDRIGALEQELARVRELIAKYREKSAEYLEDWQDWDSHDGHERCGQGIAYSDVADELEALLPDPTPVGR